MKFFRHFFVLCFCFLVSCSFTREKFECPNGDVTLVGGLANVEVLKVSCVSKDGILRVLVELQNSGEERALSYRFDWFDEDGMIIGDQEAWKPVYVYADEIKIIRTVAPNWLATDTKFFIKK